MGIAGVARDKDTELGIADAVISVDGINHDVTTGGCVGEGIGAVWEALTRSKAAGHWTLILPFTSLSMGRGLLAPADPRGLHGDRQRGGLPHSDTELPGHL